MNTTNDIFSLPRFVAFAKKEFTEQRRMLLMQFSVLLGAISLTGFAMCYGIYNSSGAQEAALKGDPMAYIHWVVLWFALAVVCFGSLAAWNMDNKAKRIARIMAPASQQEKFLLGTLLVIVVMPLFTFLTIELYDVIRYVTFNYVIDTPFRGHVQFMNLSVIISHNDNIGRQVLGLFFFQSVFVLGSSIWHKNAHVKTIVAILAVYFIMVAMALVTGTTTSTSINLTTAIDVAAAILCVANWVLAYCIFTRAEVVGRIINKK
ncbi:MAG: hypothetical protein PUD91_00400 [Bacteroidales bacterium]|nr:hypothetical protein [Bacteroidales bacterium]